jgi:copper(I)-binding protein
MSFSLPLPQITRLMRFALLAGLALPAWAQVTISDAWVRPTVPGQKATGAFMKITAQEGTQLVAVQSTVAAVTEIHEMKMDKDVMRMAAVPALSLPAGKTVELKPGGYHVMLMDLKAPLNPNTSIGLVLSFRNAQGVQSQQSIQVPVQMPAAASGAGSMTHKH